MSCGFVVYLVVCCLFVVDGLNCVGCFDLNNLAGVDGCYLDCWFVWLFRCYLCFDLRFCVYKMLWLLVMVVAYGFCVFVVWFGVWVDCVYCCGFVVCFNSVACIGFYLCLFWLVGLSVFIWFKFPYVFLVLFGCEVKVIVVLV